MIDNVPVACLAGDDPAMASERVRAFRDNLTAARSSAARQAVQLLELMGRRPSMVLTVSVSRVVEETLLAMAARGAFSSVAVAESRTRKESPLDKIAACTVGPWPPSLRLTPQVANQSLLLR